MNLGRSILYNYSGYSGGYPGYYPGGYPGYYPGCYPGTDCDFLATEVDPNKIPQKTVQLLKATSITTIMPSVFTQSQIDEITTYINNYRSLHQAPPLVWDTTIAIFSQNWANYLLKNNLFQHSGSQLYGENLAYFKGYGIDMMALLKLAVDVWYNEIKLYDFKNPGFSEETGHFTALVWKSSTTYSLGFAIDPNTDTVDITMNTSPPGNVIGQFETNVLPPSSSVSMPITTPVPVIVRPNPIIIHHHNNITTTNTIANTVGSGSRTGSGSGTGSGTGTEMKDEVIKSLYTVITSLKKNVSKDIVIHDIINIIVEILKN